VKRFYGRGLPGLDPAQLTGKLIVLEGADGSGRTTQISLLRDWLERLGHATVNVGLKRSTLVGQELARAQAGNVLGPTTRSLFYATDFADQLENGILPALKSGFIVLADRYIYTLIARDVARGAARDWVESLYGIALVPDAVFYLHVSPQQLVERNFQKKSELDYWESGMDIGLSRDRFESFMKYQRLINNEYRRMQEQYGFHVVNGNRAPRYVFNELKSKLMAFLDIEDASHDPADPSDAAPAPDPS
jgi:dTMP kinase